VTKKSKEFVQANNEFGVVEGWATGKGGEGGSYKLSDGRIFNLTLKDCQNLPQKYPIWDYQTAAKKYVLGLAFWRDKGVNFTFSGNKVALILKTKGPSYVIGRWNGVGGKIESYDTYPEFAMAREFKEETGLSTKAHQWLKFAVQRGTSDDGNDYELYCYKTYLDRDQDITIENTEGDGEIVEWFDLNNLPDIVPNLKWIIPLALDDTTGFLEIRES